VSLVTARRDDRAAAFDLLAAIGLLTPEAVGIAEIDDAGGEEGGGLKLFRY